MCEPRVSIYPEVLVWFMKINFSKKVLSSTPPYHKSALRPQNSPQMTPNLVNFHFYTTYLKIKKKIFFTVIFGLLKGLVLNPPST